VEAQVQVVVQGHLVQVVRQELVEVQVHLEHQVQAQVVLQVHQEQVALQEHLVQVVLQGLMVVQVHLV
jgi:hypothetical protein